MSLPTHRPTRLSGVLALVAALIALAVGTRGPFVIFVAAAIGVLAFTAGIVRGSRGWLAVGAMGLFVEMLLASLADTSTVLVLAGTVATLLAWDLGEHAIGLGEQLGRQAETTRQELVHAGASGFVGVVGAGIAYTVGRIDLGSVPLSAFLVGLIASMLFIAGLRT